MGHLTSRDAYKTLDQRLNLFPQGAPPSETLYKILQVLFTEKEARMVSQLPIRPFTIKKAARIWNMTQLEAEKILDSLCDKALLVDSDHNGVRKFVLPPPMIGFFEFSLMRTRGDIDQKLLSELFHRYINVEEDFIKALFFGLETKLGRVLVQEPVLLTDAVCRNFAPLYGIDEESATGTASCALAGYLYKNGCRKDRYIFEQGYSLNLPSQIFVEASSDGEQIREIFVGGYGREDGSLSWSWSEYGRFRKETNVPDQSRLKQE